MALLNNISSALIQKGKDPSGMGRWTYATILGRNNKKTTVFNVYRPGKMKVEDAGSSTVIKQQWIMMQQQGRDEHPHNATLKDLIKAIQQKQKHNHEIIVTIDGNEPFLSSMGGMATLCRICKLHDPFTHRHGDAVEGPSHINGSHRIDYIFVSLNIIESILACGATAFHDITTSDHKGFFLDIDRNSLLKDKKSVTSSPFDRSLQSSNPQVIRKYKKLMKESMEKNNVKNRLDKIILILKDRKLSDTEEKDLNQIDNIITSAMKKAESKTMGNFADEPWSPELHRAVRTLTIWKVILSQYKTRLWFEKQIKKLKKDIDPPIPTEWTTITDILRNIRKARKQLKSTKTNAFELRKQHLIRRASAMNIDQKKSSEKIIINLIKIEQIIKMWKKINHLTKPKHNNAIHTIDIPVDASVGGTT